MRKPSRIEKEAFASVDQALCRADYEAAFRLAQPWAEKEYGWAEGTLGSAYHLGFGAERNFDLAATYYERAAQHGVAGAYFALGTLFSVGDETHPADPEKARRYYALAAELGYVPGAPLEEFLDADA